MHQNEHGVLNLILITLAGVIVVAASAALVVVLGLS
jgi:hypothetical protein